MFKLQMAAALSVAATLAACSSSGGSGTPSGSTSPSAAPVVTPTPTPSGPPLVAWVVKSGSSLLIRVLAPSGAAPHALTSVPGDSMVLGFGAGKIAMLYSDHTIHVFALSTGTATSFASGATSADFVSSGAFSPDGARFAYDVVTTSSGSLRVVNLATGASSVLHTFSSNTVDAPVGWTATRIVALTVVAFSDAGSQASVALDPNTGMETSSTSIAGAGGSAWSADGIHVADTFHSSLGDEGDSPGGPGPPQPFNTLRTYTIGATPSLAYQMAHHQISVFAVSPDGSTVVYHNDSAAGGFAGISMSPDFGLFFLHGGVGMQLTHYGEIGRWDSGAFVDNSTAMLAVHAGGDEHLVLVGPSHTPPSLVDSVSGADAPVFVGYSPIS